ncbi:MAG: hypothetical protein ACOY30_07285 [Bacillota bacterium]
MDMTELNNLQKKLEQSLKLKAHCERELSQLRNKYEGKQRIIAQSKLMHNVVELATRLCPGSCKSTQWCAIYWAYVFSRVHWLRTCPFCCP